MNNSEQENIINSIFGENSAKLDSDAPNCRYFNYRKTGIYVVIDEEQCALKLFGYPKGQPVSLSLAKFVHALFKNEANVKIGATLKQSFEEERGTTYYPLSKDDFLLEMNEIDWDKSVSLTWFSIFFEESDFEEANFEESTNFEEDSEFTRNLSNLTQYLIRTKNTFEISLSCFLFFCFFLIHL